MNPICFAEQDDKDAAPTATVSGRRAQARTGKGREWKRTGSGDQKCHPSSGVDRLRLRHGTEKGNTEILPGAVAI